MTYQEMQERLTKVETLIKAVQQPRYQNTVQNVQETLSKLSTIKENLENKMKILAESEENMFVTTKTGGTKSVSMSTKQAMDLKRDPNVTGIETTKGKDLKEGEDFKGRNIYDLAIDLILGADNPQKSSILIVPGAYKIKRGGSTMPQGWELEEFFKQGEDGLKADDIKELFETLAKDLQKTKREIEKRTEKIKVEIQYGYGKEELLVFHTKFKIDKSINEEENKFKEGDKVRIDREYGGGTGTVDYTSGSFVVLTNGKSYHESNLTLIKSANNESINEAPDNTYYIRVASGKQYLLLDSVLLELGIRFEIDDIPGEVTFYFNADSWKMRENRAKKLIKKNKIIILGSNIPSYQYIFKTDYEKRRSDENTSLREYIEHKGVDEFLGPALYRDFDDYVVSQEATSGDTREQAVDTLLEFLELNFKKEVVNEADIWKRFDEKQKLRVKIQQAEKRIKKIEEEIEQLEIDQQEKAEPGGGPIADEYSRQIKEKKIEKEVLLKKIDKIEEELDYLDNKYIAEEDQANNLLKQDALSPAEYQKAKKLKGFDSKNYKWDKNQDLYIIRKMNEGDEMDGGAQQGQLDDEGNDPVPYHDEGDQIREDLDLEHHDIAGMEVPAEDHDDLDIGHQDDEPDMLKQTAFEIAMYGAKLYKQLNKYDKMDGEVDFPNWWQSKVILAKDYISKAQHYLDFEDKQPIIDKLALEEDVEEPTKKDIKKGEKDSISKIVTDAQKAAKWLKDNKDKTADIIQKKNKKEELTDGETEHLEQVKKYQEIKKRAENIQETKISKKRFKELLAEAYYEVIAEQEAGVNTEDSLQTFFNDYGISDPDKNNPNKPVNPIIRLHGSKKQAEQELEREVTTNPGGENFTFKLKGGQEYDLYKKDGDNGMWTVEIRGNKHHLDASGIKDAQEDLRILSKEAPTPKAEDPAEFEDDASGGADAFTGGGGGGAGLGGGTGTGGGEADVDAETETDTAAPIATGDSELEFDTETEA